MAVLESRLLHPVILVYRLKQLSLAQISLRGNGDAKVRLKNGLVLPASHIDIAQSILDDDLLRALLIILGLRVVEVGGS